MEHLDKQDSNTLPLFPVQKWLLETIVPPHHWNISYMFYKKTGWKADGLAFVLEKTAAHHDVFLYRFIKNGNEYFQKTDRKLRNAYLFREIDLRRSLHEKNSQHISVRLHAEMEAAQKHINVFTGPVFILHLYKTGEGDYLYFVMSHLFFDGFSMKIMIDDILTACSQYAADKDIVFRKKAAGYREALEEVYRFSRSSSIKEEIRFWEQTIYRDDPLFPVDRKVNAEDRIERNMTDVQGPVLSEKEYSGLKHIFRQRQIRGFDFYLTMLAVTLCRYKKSSGIRIHIINHGRNWSIGDLDITGTAGPFWLTFPVYLEPGPDIDAAYETEKTGDLLKSIPHHGRGFEILKEISLEKTGFKTRANSLPDVILFNFLGFLNERVKWSGDRDIRLSPYFTDLNRDTSVACPYTLIFNLRQVEKGLHLQIIYNTFEFNPDSIKAIFARFRSEMSNNARLLGNREKQELGRSV